MTETRNWRQITQTLADDLHTDVGPLPLPKRPCYQFEKDDIVWKTMNKFVQETFYKRSINFAKKKPSFLRNHLTGSDIRVSKENDFTIGMLGSTFADLGHCLAYKLADTYVVPLMLDLDCYNCKRGNCSSNLRPEIAPFVHDEIVNYVRKTLNNDNVNCAIFKSSSRCNLHIYFNVSVSIVVMELIRKRLRNHLDVKITDKFHVDDVTMLDLPYSTKDGLSVYRLFYATKGFDYAKMSCLPSESQFYDVSLKLSVDDMHDSHVTLGRFKTIHVSTWNDDVEHNKHVLTPLVFKPTLVRLEPPLVTSMKFVGVKDFISDFSLMTQYFSRENEDENQPSAVNTYDFSEDELKILKQLKAFNEVLAKKVFVDARVYENSVSNVLRFITFSHSNYAFYVVSSIIMYIYSFNTVPEIEDCKELVVKILKNAIRNSGHSKNDSVMHTLNCIEKFKCMKSLSVVFENHDAWLRHLIQLAKLDMFGNDISLNEKKVQFITTQFKLYETLEMLYDDLVELCSMLLPIIKVEHGLNKIHYYVDVGVYVPMSMQQFFSVSTVQIQSVERILRKLLLGLKESNQVSDAIYDKVKLKDVWLKYFESLTLENPPFNFYDYFISTDLGVFNTLTGLYMAHTPLLYMSTQKSYCIVPHVPTTNLSMHELNRYLLQESQTMLYSNILDILLNHQNFIFYGSIMIPGLLSLPETLFDKKQERDIQLLLYKKIMCDDDMNSEKMLYLVEPLFIAFQMNMEQVLNFSELIKDNIVANGEFTRDDLRQFHESKVQKHHTYEFVQNTNIPLHDQLAEEMPHVFKPKFFALAVIMTVFERVRNDGMCQHYVGNKYTPLELSNLHMFYNAKGKCSASMRSNECLVRVVEYLCNNEVPESLIALIKTLSASLRRNNVFIKDFLNAFAMIYNHTSKRKKMILLLGSPNSGKSTFQNMLMDMHGRSAFSISSVVQAEGQAPSPEVINALSKHVFSVIELKAMTAATLKSMVSGDITHKRYLHQNDMLQLRPLSIAIAAANNLPNIYQADEAVRDRLAPFKFTKFFVDESQIETVIDDNVLLGEVSMCMVSTTHFQIADLAKEFSNLLYEFYQTHRDAYGLMAPHTSSNNTMSQKLLSQILTKNNIVYYILNASGIKFDPNLSITYEALEEAVKEQIELYKTKVTTKRSYDWRAFKNEVSFLFQHKEFSDKTGINGFGLPLAGGRQQRDDDSIVLETCIKRAPGESISIQVLKSYLFYQKNLPYNKLSIVISNAKTKYANYYDTNGDCIKDHILNHD